MTVYKSQITAFILAAVLMAAPISNAHAEDKMMMSMDHGTMKMDGGAMKMGEEQKPAGLYDKAMQTMHEGMSAVKVTGDADVDFVRGMIPHHQGAIDMAKVVLEKGKDPEIRKLAEGIVAAQEKEIAQMNEWLKKHDTKK